MHKYYIINDVVEFHPATRTLRNLKNPNREVVLNSPAGRCLLLLIERAGSIVTQQECMDIVWQRRGMMVSSNTFYQNVFILRKGLKKIAFDTDPIVTIPRVGLTLASDIKIVVQEAQHQMGNGDNTLNLPEQEKSVASPESGGTPYIAVPVSKPVFWLLVGLLILLMLSGVSIMGHSFTRENDFVDGYRFIRHVDTCRVMLANNIQVPDDQEKALSWAERFKSECKKYPWVYISRRVMPPRASVLRCDRPMNEPNHCMSDYFVEDP